MSWCMCPLSISFIRNWFTNQTSSNRTYKNTKSFTSKMEKPPVVIPAKDGNHSATLVFLHGLGDTGDSWAEQFSIIKPPHVKVICPNAPIMSVTLNMGMRMPSWFDLYALSVDAQEDVEGIKRASEYISSIINEEETKYNIPSDKIMLGGFSQGAALTLYTGLKYPRKLAGLIVLSGWLPLRNEFPGYAGPLNSSVPVIQCHGESDMLLPIMIGRMSQSILSSFLTNYEFKSYPKLVHSTSNEEMMDVINFINKNL